MTEAVPRAARMSLWRLEWLRLIRTPRAIAIGAVFIAFGLIEPVLTRYENRLLGSVGHGVRITLPPPTPQVALSAYLGDAFQIGLIVVVALAAGAFSFDARLGLATFLRTRVASMWQLVAPRFAVCAAAAVAGFVLGTLAAWYETQLLIGSLPVAGMLAGLLCGAVYLAFAVAVTALAASVVRGTLATTAVSIVALLVLPIAGTLRPLSNWLPSALAGAPVDLASGAHQLPHYLPAIGMSLAAGAAALALAVLRLRTREI